MTPKRALLATGVALTFAACGYGAETNVRELTEDELFGLDQTTTTSTTTTTTTTLAPPISADVTPTSTTLPVVIEPVTLFFLDGEGLFPVQINLTQRPSLQRVLDALEEGTQQAGSAGLGLRSAVPEGLFGQVSQAGGVVSVDLVPEVYERIDPRDELAAIAQTVMTLTAQPGVGQVVFTRGGDPIRVRLGNNQVSEPSEPVTGDDYRMLLVTSAAPPSVPEPPDTTPTTEPPTDTSTPSSPPTGGG